MIASRVRGPRRLVASHFGNLSDPGVHKEVYGWWLREPQPPGRHFESLSDHSAIRERYGVLCDGCAGGLFEVVFDF